MEPVASARPSARRLADDHHYVVATYIPAGGRTGQDVAVRQQRADGYDFGIIECDVADYDACETMARQMEKECGRIDVLVNAAGITRDATLRKMDPESWHAVLDTNLDSVFNVTRNFIDMMVERQYGRVINISSVNGQKGQLGQTNYSAAKAGMVGFTKSLALELADSKVTVNTVSPGYVATRMVEAIPDEVKQQIISKILLAGWAGPRKSPALWPTWPARTVATSPALILSSQRWPVHWL
ncbi:MAG: SDR family NAD(P)-dependent oxidoreductase [Gammaproteobacteria bacterium]|nr:SDR family NAD(P)-dependent oxidoreductase [Gammaproteobacteria bacterium]